MKMNPKNTLAASADPDLAKDAAELQEALNELVRVYQFRDRKRICCHDISVTQCHAMRAVHNAGTLTLGGLAESLYLDNSTASRVVASLDRKGYTRRLPDATDGRVIRIELTRAGRDLYRRIERDLVAEQQALLSDFDPDVRQATTRLIARLARQAAERVSRDDGSCCRTD